MEFFCFRKAKLLCEHGGAETSAATTSRCSVALFCIICGSFLSKLNTRPEMQNSHFPVGKRLLRFVSGWQDSNLRPPGPKPGAMTGLRYIPNRPEGQFLCAVRAGFEPAVQLPVRQFSKLVVSASHPPHRDEAANVSKNMFHQIKLKRFFIYTIRH